MQIGERLRIAREAISFTLERAANESGILHLGGSHDYKRGPAFCDADDHVEAEQGVDEELFADDADQPEGEPDMLAWRDRGLSG